MKLKTLLPVIIGCFFSSSIVNAQAINTQDSLALVDLYDSTNGSGWISNTNWLTAAPVSTWYGVTQVLDGRVTGLYLTLNNLTGQLPSSIGNLTKLTSLQLFINKISGSIPSSLGNLTDISTLDLYNNLLTDTIPASLGNLTKLTDLNLFENSLTGSIPASLGNLVNLNTLVLSNNQLSGTIPSSLGNLVNLGNLILSYNQLNGSIPSSLGNLVNLYQIILSYNQLSGTIPSSLGNLVSLDILYLALNQLSGIIPSSLGNLTYLRGLYLSFNQLSGNIPANLGNLAGLIELHLNNNQLNGSIPSSLGSLTNLKVLSLSFNQLSDSIPSSFYNLTNLHALYLNDNQFSGSVPYLPSSLGINSSSPLNPAFLYIQDNRFTFNGMENLPYADSLLYAPQANIPIILNQNTLSVSAGGTPSNCTFRLYQNGVLLKTQVADSVFPISANGNYYITATNAIATNLTLYSDTVNVTTLPLTLLNFTGTMQHNEALLQWQTTDEINTKSFTVERSDGSTPFTPLGVVNAVSTPGINNYSFTDTKPLEGLNYYRLAMTDKDGAYTYSNILTLKMDGLNFALSVYPNPAQNTATISFTNAASSKYSINVTDAAGKTIKRINGVATPGVNTVQLDIQGFAPGVYLITLNSADGKHTLKLVRQ